MHVVKHPRVGFLRGLLANRRGVSLVEYALLIAAILLVAAVAFRVLGNRNSEATRIAEGKFVGRGDTLNGSGLPTLGSGDPGGSSSEGDPGSSGAGDPGGGDNPGSSGDNAPPAPVAFDDTTKPANGGGGDGEKKGGGGFWGGVGDFFEGAVKGDFGGDNGWAGLAGQVVVGFIPIAGQIGDVRDTIAGIKAVATGEPGGWAQLGGAAIAWVPGVGDLGKAAIKGARQADETAEVAAKTADEVVPPPPLRSRADAAKLLDESNARVHVPREGEDPAILAASRKQKDGVTPKAENTVFRSGRQGEQALRDILNERAAELANLKPGEVLSGKKPLSETMEGFHSTNGEVAQRVQIKQIDYTIQKLPNGELKIIHYQPVPIR